MKIKDNQDYNKYNDFLLYYIKYQINKNAMHFKIDLKDIYFICDYILMNT